METRDYSKDFKTLNIEVNGNRLVYLDSAATTQKPNVVIEAIKNYYENINANPHRGAYYLSVEATKAYEESRETVKCFINAKTSKEVIFTKNATEAFNLLAFSYGMDSVKAGDEIVISIAEHHSNLIPWQRVAKAKGATLKYMYTNEFGELTLDEIKSKITEKTKIVSVAQVSNALGTINNIKEIIDYAHSKGSIVIVDAAQSIPHMKVDVQELDVDFLVFSGHKLLAPMGIGVLFGKEELLQKMPPFMLGGDMVEYVYEQEATFDELPFKFEGGTQNVEAAIGLKVAIDYLEEIGMETIAKIEKELMTYAMDEIKKLPYVTVYGPSKIENRSGVISFEIEGVHPHDVASIFDSHGVAIRAGNHCAQPLMRYMGINSTCRASFYLYNKKEDVDKLIEVIKSTYNMFSKWR
ncbi:cysteine desulfurase [Clostridium gasigenes]|uniref:cysteine desulfurase n=1 Tax=Clostridium gasigenes TaxID=94869 RepID=UPI0014386117|nr:cysteine desulfurase [Clostridium gasigenes]NKF08095.1 cysteine desulfurase [Clostridium gasigenes]QSW18550.1 cysteine desulfurase [Clostridium gasigenes]